MVAFWTSVAVAVFLLGGTIASVEAAVRRPSWVNDIVLALSVIGLAIAGAVAGRIILVVGRAQRKSRPGNA